MILASAGDTERAARHILCSVIALTYTCRRWSRTRSVLDAQGGRRRDVNISSEAGMIGHAGVGAYVASKWGVRGLTRRACPATTVPSVLHRAMRDTSSRP
jgi:NAD(P)-dependent dehydrogenase (short-subunit alcohol dehydrogenase family)